MSRPTPVLLDCDPGHDDALAILLAYGSPSIRLLAITTVGGNQTLAKVTNNAYSVARIAGILSPTAPGVQPGQGIPIVAGAPAPLVRPVVVAEAIHGETGLDGPVLPPPQPWQLDPRSGVQVIIDTVLSAPDDDPVTLIATGPLTNLALAVRTDARIAARVKEVVLMGGGIHTGNWSPVAEFNMVVDPEAAHVVFSAGWKVTMVGLDVTHQALATPAVRDRIRGVGTGPAKFVDELLQFFGETYKLQQGFEAPPVHDAVAVAYVVDKSVLGVVNAPIEIETQGRVTTGMTVVDLRRLAPAGCQTWAATTVDVDKFWGLMVDALVRIGSPEV